MSQSSATARIGPYSVTQTENSVSLACNQTRLHVFQFASQKEAADHYGTICLVLRLAEGKA